MIAPKRFRKKPVEIEAMQWDGTAAGATPIIDWVLSNGGTARYHCTHDMGCDDGPAGHTLAIDTLEGTMQARPGDWIIRGVQGEFYPCRPDIFEQTYEAIDKRISVSTYASIASEETAVAAAPQQRITCRAAKRDADGYPWLCDATALHPEGEHVWVPDR